MKHNKLLVIIPAHNEAANIGKVLDMAKKSLRGADILVIDDCSTDDTRAIAEQKNVKCITTVFNLRYAMAIQTGLKYAYDHDYDYVIQMDGDGQHLPSEAKKLYDEAKKSDVDIVIGSRYLKNLGYPCPFFRKIGTKIFSALIRILCKTKIADPLTGFQCLNRRVIAHYATCGNYPEFPDANLIIEMLMKGYRISEIPTKMHIRESGESMHDGVWNPSKYMITEFYACLITAFKNFGRKEQRK